MGRERSVSPSRDRGRKRSRSRSRERRGWSDPDPTAQGLAVAAAEAQRFLAQQAANATLSGLPSVGIPGLGGADVHLPPPPMVSAAALPQGVSSAIQSMLAAAPPAPPPGMTAAQAAAARKAREIYIGNLAIGQTTAEVLKELFNAALAGFVDNPATQQAVSEVKMDPVGGRFAFVEFLTEELATQALTLTGTEVFGKGMKIARPSGYVGPQEKAGTAANDKLALAQQLAAKLASGGVTHVVLLEGLVDAATIRIDDERQEVSEMVYEETLRCGRVKGVAVPVPPFDVDAAAPCRVYVKYDSNMDAQKCKDMMDGRMFDDRQVKADYVTEVEYNRAVQGEWFTGNITDAPQQLLAPMALASGASMPIGGSLTGLPTIQL